MSTRTFNRNPRSAVVAALLTASLGGVAATNTAVAVAAPATAPSSTAATAAASHLTALVRGLEVIDSIPDTVLRQGDAALRRYVSTRPDLVRYVAATQMAQPDSWWDTVKCVGAITFAIGSTLVSVAKILKIKKYLSALGGVTRAAELLLKATTWEEKLRIGGTALVGLAAELFGITAVREACHI